QIRDEVVADQAGAEIALALRVPEPLAVSGVKIAHLNIADQLLRNVADALVCLRGKRGLRAPDSRRNVREDRAVVPEETESATELDRCAVARRKVHVLQMMVGRVVAVVILIVEEAGLIVLETLHVQVAKDIAARRSRSHQEKRIGVAGYLRADAHGKGLR